MKFTHCLLLCLVFASCTPANVEPPHAEVKYTNPTELSVMITSLPGTSGGSGIIISSGILESKILTNSHVCELAKSGAFVINEKEQKYAVSSFRQSKLHDLCVISVYSDLGLNARIAPSAPKKYDGAHIIGHPHLMPTIITDGYFSSKKEIEIMMGWQVCSENDKQNPDTMFLCGVIGKVPLLKKYDSIIVSALIQPGSSGSPIFNDKGELSALVFAGEGDIGFATAVPYEYIVKFLSSEYNKLPDEYPNLMSGQPSTAPESVDERDFQEACKNAKTDAQKRYCQTSTNIISY